jgi:hypothetical protein
MNTVNCTTPYGAVISGFHKKNRCTRAAAFSVNAPSGQLLDLTFSLIRAALPVRPRR